MNYPLFGWLCEHLAPPLLGTDLPVRTEKPTNHRYVSSTDGLVAASNARAASIPAIKGCNSGPGIHRWLSVQTQQCRRVCTRVHLPTNICYFLFYILNSPVFYNSTPLVPEGTEHRLGGLHPGAPSLFPSLTARVCLRHTVPVGTGRPVRGR